MNQAGRSPQITERHLRRKAIIYVRQSTDAQVRNNLGSTAYQLAQVSAALARGWPRPLIVLIDEDLGASGSSTIHRVGYQKMLRMIQAGEVGIVFVIDLSRLGRKLVDQVQFIEECRIHGVLLDVGGRLHDPRDKSDRLLTTVVLTVSEFENDARRDALVNGRQTRAREGYAVSNPPAGYVKQKGNWLKDPDPEVRVAVATALRLVIEERSLVKAVARMVRMGMKLPRRRGAFVEWVPPEVGKLGFMARNRAYAGDYIFRKRCVDPSLGRRGNGRLKERPALESEMIVRLDNHEPYLTREEWNEIQHILDINAPSQLRRNPGPGGAILQGVMRCGKHDAAMSARRKGDSRGGVRVYTYACPGERMRGGPGCISVTARPIEHAVVATLMTRLEPPSIEIIHQSWVDSKRAADSEKSRQDFELDRLRRRVDHLRRRCSQVDISTPRIAAELEAQLDAAERELAHVETNGADPNPLDAFTEETFDELVALCGDIEAIWAAETTADRDRKEIVRTMISDVILEERTTEEFKVRVRWADGAPDEQVPVKRNAYAHRVIDELAAQGLDAAAIAESLNEMGLRTLKDNPWTKATVATALWHRKKDRSS